MQQVKVASPVAFQEREALGCTKRRIGKPARTDDNDCIRTKQSVRKPKVHTMPGSTIRVVLVDGDAAIRRNLRERLAETDDIHMSGETENECQAFDLIAGHQPDVVVLVAQVPNNQRIDVIRQLRTRGSTAGILVLLLSEDAQSIKAAIDAGANGFALLSSPIEEVIEAVRAVHEANQVSVQIRRCAGAAFSIDAPRHNTP
jgi:DNA-binding NarL/FixJ family response regulator